MELNTIPRPPDNVFFLQFLLTYLFIISVLFIFALMKVQGDNIAEPVGKLIRERSAILGISQVELASRCNEHAQTISAILNGQRELSISLSVKMDAALGLEPGSLAYAQARYQVAVELQRQKDQNLHGIKNNILEKIKAAGGFWSYQGIPEHLDDDSIIEAALVHMELEDLPMLLKLWSKSHLKRVWKERLVSQGKRMNILNYILSVKLFGVKHPDKYLSRYAR